ncbi:plasmid-related protein [Erwinia amylovora]|uniref:plasmid-related protein n=1 Tax=Erwinia amylovora TaxID=552 RepID=UPI0014449936|nr:plasmid-related protein [Erwinia amylovora]
MQCGKNKINALIDLSSVGTMVCTTMVLPPQDTPENESDKACKKAIGENTKPGWLLNNQGIAISCTLPLLPPCRVPAI